MSDTIYRVFDKKNKYQQSYSPKLKDAYSLAVSCADSAKGIVREDVLGKAGLTESSKVVYTAKVNGS